ncbi:MAG TPA: DUF4397 domain-containing protein [Micromonosporaceae bacterium]
MRVPLIRRTLTAAVAGLTALVGVAVASATPAEAQATSTVFVVHGIPGQPVDVYVNGKKTLSDFQPATVAGPLSLAAGSYKIALTKPGAPVSNAILTVDNAQVPAGQNLSLVAHLDASGQPSLTAFVNDTSAVAAGKARITVRHVAAAPAVDVRANGQAVFSNLTNPNEAKADVDAGSVRADVVLAGTQTVVLGPATLNLAAGTNTIVYAIGSANDKTLAFVVQTLTGLGGAPGVPAGSGGLAGTGVGASWYLLVTLGGVLLLVGAATVTRRTLSRRRPA